MDSDQPDAALIEQACRVAQGKEIVYLFAGLPDCYEAEGFDRESMAMPEEPRRVDPGGQQGERASWSSSCKADARWRCPGRTGCRASC